MQITLRTPPEIRDQIWKELIRSVHDRHHAWRTPVLSTLSIDGGVNSRTVVLRGANEDENNLWVYTDARSPKVTELRNNNNGFFVFWSPRLHWQLRIKVNIAVLTSGPLVDDLWKKVSQSGAITDYINSSRPGSKLIMNSEPVNTHESNEHYFAVLRADVNEIDWLELSGSRHRRAKITDKSWDWLTP